MSERAGCALDKETGLSSYTESPDRRNSKAEVKAAKAYAKAVRPWYAKKRWIIPLGLIVLIAVTSAMSGNKTTSSSTSPASGTATASQTASESVKDSGGNGSVASSSDSDAASTAGKVGEAVANAGTTYEVTRAYTTRVVGDPDLLGARADGQFVVVSLELTNTKDETKTFSEASAKLETSDGKAYETSDKTVMAFGDDSLLLKDIQPDLTTHGKLAFDVPPAKVAGSTLVIEDLYGSGEVRVALGL